jgi:nicotinate-nucleotide adenylyltransferase
MKVGFFGGSFDPPHMGHIALARLAIERLGLDRVLMAPVGAQPLKRDESAPFADRVAMVRLAIANQPRIELSLIDAPRPDGGVNYTVDTVKALRDRLDPADRLYCLMGADSFLTIGKWHRAGVLLSECDFVVGSRPGFDLQQIAAALPEGFSIGPQPIAGAKGCQRVSLAGKNGRESCLYLLTDLSEDISATEIREELQNGQEMGIDPAVSAYIQDHGLYRGSKES